MILTLSQQKVLKHVLTDIRTHFWKDSMPKTPSTLVIFANYYLMLLLITGNVLTHHTLSNVCLRTSSRLLKTSGSMNILKRTPSRYQLSSMKYFLEFWLWLLSVTTALAHHDERIPYISHRNITSLEFESS